MSELQLLRCAQGVWTGEHRIWFTPTSPAARSTSQAMVLAARKQAAVAVALRWATDRQDYDATLLLRSNPEDRRFYGRWAGSHPRLPRNIVLRGGASSRHGIMLHGEDGDRPWEITIGRNTHEVAVTVYDLAASRPELPVMHATYPTRLLNVPLVGDRATAIPPLKRTCATDP